MLILFLPVTILVQWQKVKLFNTNLATTFTQITVSDLTDKFDYTFVFGDLNFRLDISRLHADWLISRQGLYIHLFRLF